MLSLNQHSRFSPEVEINYCLYFIFIDGCKNNDFCLFSNTIMLLLHDLHFGINEVFMNSEIV